MSGSKTSVTPVAVEPRTCRIPIDDNNILASIHCPAETGTPQPPSSHYVVPSRTVTHVVEGRGRAVRANPLQRRAGESSDQQSRRILEKPSNPSSTFQIQAGLQKLGFGGDLGPKSIDGRKGPLTLAAIENFRSQYNAKWGFEMLKTREEAEARILSLARDPMLSLMPRPALSGAAVA